MFHQLAQLGLLEEHARILPCLVVVAESFHLHAVQSVHILYLEVEVTHQEVGEVIAGQFEEQLVLADAVGLVGNHEDEGYVVLGTQFHGGYRVAVAHHDGPSAPHVAHVELSSAQLSSALHSVDDHAGQFADAALREFLHHLLHVSQASVAVAVVQLAQSAYEDELVAVGTHGEPASRQLGIADGLVQSVGFEGLVGGGVERVFHVLAVAHILLVVRVGEQCGPLALRILALQARQPCPRLPHVALAGIEQEEVVIHVVHVLVVGILVGEPSQMSLAEPQVVELVFEDDARMVESVLQYLVAGCHLLLGEGYLRQVVLAAVRVEGGAVGGRRLVVRQAVGRHVGSVVVCQSVGVVGCLRARHHRLVDALPVVHILALAPQFLEGGLTLADGQRVVEIPCVGLLRADVPLGSSVLPLHHVVAAPVALHLLLGILLSLAVALLLLLPFQFGYHAVDGGITVFLAHLGECLQRILQVDGVGIGCQLVEYLRAFRQLLVVVAVLVQQSDGLSVAASGIAELLLLPVQVAQVQQQHTLLNAVARALLVALLVGGNGVHGVFLCEVDIADGIVHLVQVFLVVVVGGHALQLAYHLACPAASHHLGHGDAGVELNLVGGIQPHHVLESLVGLRALALCRIDLSQQIPFARLLLLAHLVLDYLLQVGNGLVKPLLVQVVVGIGVVPLLHGAPVQRVAVHLRYHVLGIVGTVVLYVAFRQPRPCLAVDGRLRLVEAAHIGKGDGGLLKLALHELRAPHQQPRLPQKRVVFQAAQPLYVARGLLAVLRPFGPPLDAVQLDGLLAFLDSPVEVALAQLLAAFVGHGVERNDVGEVVLVAVLLLQGPVDVGLRAVVVGVVFRVERVPPAAAGGILGCRAREEQRHAPHGHRREHTHRPGATSARAVRQSAVCPSVVSHVSVS